MTISNKDFPRFGRINKKMLTKEWGDLDKKEKYQTYIIFIYLLSNTKIYYPYSSFSDTMTNMLRDNFDKHVTKSDMNWVIKNYNEDHGFTDSASEVKGDHEPGKYLYLTNLGALFFSIMKNEIFDYGKNEGLVKYFSGIQLKYIPEIYK